MSRVDMLGEQSFFFPSVCSPVSEDYPFFFFGDIFHLLIMLFHTLFAHSYNHHSPPSIKFSFVIPSRVLGVGWAVKEVLELELWVWCMLSLHSTTG